MLKAQDASTARAWFLLTSGVLVIRVATYNILGSHFLQDGSPICLDLVGAACTELRSSN